PLPSGLRGYGSIRIKIALAQRGAVHSMPWATPPACPSRHDLCETCVGEWVRAVFAYGIRALSECCSIADATTGPIFNLDLTPLRNSRPKKRSDRTGCWAALRPC